MRRLLLIGCLWGAGALLTACSDGGDEGGFQPPTGCGEDTQERIDPDALVHILPGTPEPEYLTDPPTSGAHAPAAPHGGVVDEPLSRSDQLGQLEGGIVLIQHGYAFVDPDDESGVEALAGDLVLVAPNNGLPAPIVATAWTRKLVCNSLGDGGLEALQAFIEDHAGEGPGSDAGG